MAPRDEDFPPVAAAPHPASNEPPPHAGAIQAAAAASVAPLAIARMSAVLVQNLLDTTASLAARLPFTPLSPQHAHAALAGSRGEEAGALTPDVAAATLPPRSASPHTFYGMGLGEAESVDEESDDEDITTRQLRQLQASQAFQDLMRAKGLSAADVAANASRLRLYKKLRSVDPAGFWRLVRAGTRTGWASRQASPAVLAADFLLSTLVNVAVLALLAAAWLEPRLPLAVQLLLTLCAWSATAAAWANGRSTTGKLFDLWYEELQWRHPAPAWRAFLANLLDLLYVCGTLGLGLPLSLGMRAWGGRRQSVGELLAGLAAVQEVRVSLHDA